MKTQYQKRIIIPSILFLDVLKHVGEEKLFSLTGNIQHIKPDWCMDVAKEQKQVQETFV